MNPPKVTASQWLSFALAAAVGSALVRLLFIDQGLWADEVQSVEIANTPLDELLTRTGLLDVHPPLYYLLLKAWNGLGGDSDLWSRLLSLSMGSLTVGFFVLWARRHIQGIALGVGTGLLAFSTWHIHYSIEVRSYALLAMMVLLLCWQVERWLEDSMKSPRAMILIILLTIATGLTHYYGLFCVLGINVYVFAHQHMREPHLRSWAATQAAALGCMAWWLPFFFVQALDLPDGFTAHLEEGPALTELISAFGPAAALPTSVAVLAGSTVLLLALWGLRGMKQTDPPAISEATEESHPRIRWALVLAGLGLTLSFVSPAFIPEPPLEAGHPALNTYMAHGVDLVSERIPLVFLLVIVAWLCLLGATRLPNLVPRHTHRSAAPLVIATVLVIGGTLHLIKPSLSTRNLLALLPLVILLASRSLSRLRRVPGIITLVAVVFGSGLSLMSASATFHPRADFAGPAELIHQQTTATTAPQVYVISAFDNGAVQRYLGPQTSQGIMSPNQLQGLARAPVYVMLTREAWENATRFTDAFKRQLASGFELKESHTFREVELLIFSPLKSSRESPSRRPGFGSVPPQK